MRKFALVSILFAIMSAAAFAQSAEKLTELIRTERVTYGQAAYFAASSLGIVTDGASPEASLQVVNERKLLPENEVSAKTEIPLSDFAYLCAKTWDIKGSLMYSLFPTPRYAFKMLQAKGIIPAGADPSKLSDGHEAVNIINACVAYSEGGSN